MAEGLGGSIESLVGQSHLRELLPQCCQDPSPDVRQSAFALVGDLSRVCAPHLHPVIKQLLALAIQNMEARCIDPHNMSACNNACWSLGKLLGRGCPAAVPVCASVPVSVSTHNVYMCVCVCVWTLPCCVLRGEWGQEGGLYGIFRC